MPTTLPGAAVRPAERQLFNSLIDDAAVFPPGNAPLDRAIREHLKHRTSWYASLVGPLLVPASSAADFLRLAGVAEPPSPLAAGVIARPGTDPSVVREALSLLVPSSVVSVVGVEMGWTPKWREAGTGRLPLSLEVPRGDAQAGVIADIAKDANDSSPVQAKFRTGATPTWPWPDEQELANFIRTAIDHDLGFKLTGELHHAVRGTHAVDGAGSEGASEEQHGLLNVLCAVRWALNGEEVNELVPLLQQRDPAPLVEMIARMSNADASIVRAFFTAYGCCTVTDPIGELAALNLIEA